jgi:hypothetical protein
MQVTPELIDWQCFPPRDDMAVSLAKAEIYFAVAKE